MTASEVTVSDQRAETWKPIPGCSGYEASDNSVWRPGEDGKLVQVSGGIRSIDRMVGGRQLKGVVLKCRLNGGGRGDRYVLVNITDDQGVKRTMLAHRLILLAHDKPCPEGMETLHSERGPLWCRFPEDIRYGTKKENIGETIAAGNARRPAAHPCINHERCGGMVVNPGRRCLPCVMEVGREAAAMLSAGLLLDEVTRRLGYQSNSWVEKLARDYGGFAGPLPQSWPRQPRVPRQPWPQRAMATLRYRLKIGRRSH